MVQSSTYETTSRLETMPADVVTHEEVIPSNITRWGAVVAGAFTAISLQIVFAVLGAAIGLTIIGTSDDAPERTLSIGGAIYWVISGLVSLFVGGWVAGRLRNTRDGFLGLAHGFLAWCTVTVLSTALFAMASGTAVGGSLAALSNAMPEMQADRAVNGRSSVRPTQDNVGRTDEIDEVEAKDAAKSAAGASWWTFVALVLGATVASAGGLAATRTETDRVPRVHTTNR